MSDRRRNSYYLGVILVFAILLILLSAVIRQQAVVADNGSEQRPFAVQYDAHAKRRPSVKLAGWVSEAGSAHWVIGGHELQVDSVSATAVDVCEGMYAIATARVDGEGGLHAETISLQLPSSPSGYGVEFRGLIEEINARYWLVSKQLVFVTENTRIQGRPEIGALAEVKGLNLFDDIVLARTIKVIVPDRYAEVEFEGTIENITEHLWVIGGVTVTISPVTVIQGAPAVGLLAEVQGVLQPDGSVLAQQISVSDAGPTPQTDIEGLVESIETTYWMIAGTTVFIDSQTFIDDSQAPADVGMWAQVRALRRQDGTLLALRIRLSRPS